MFSIGWAEIGLIVLVALILFKPEEWPDLFYKVGLFVKRIQRFIESLKYQMDAVLQEREIEEMKQNSYERVKKLDRKLQYKKKKNKEDKRIT